MQTCGNKEQLGFSTLEPSVIYSETSKVEHNPFGLGKIY